MLSSKTVPEKVRRVQAGKQKHSGKRAGDRPQPSQATTPSVTPTSSFMDGSSKETKQVSLRIKYISTTNIIYWRYQTRSICFIRFSRAFRKALKWRRVISFTNAIMVGGRFLGLQRRWGIASTVWSTPHKSPNSTYTSSGSLSRFRPYRKSQNMLTWHVQVLLLPQRSRPTCSALTRGEENRIGRDRPSNCETCRVHAMPRRSSTVTQGRICTATGESRSKWYVPHAVIFFSSSYLGTLEPGKIRRAVDQMDCCLRSTVRRGRESGANRPSYLCPPIPIVTQDTQPLHSQAPRYEDGCRGRSRNEGFVCCTLTYLQYFNMLIRN